MQEPTANPHVDEALLKRFQSEIGSKVPHLVESDGNKTFVNPTPLEDLTAPLIECARVEYGLDMPFKSKVLGKFDSKIIGGSVNVGAAVEIIEIAIDSCTLGSAETVFDATSGI